MWPEVEKAKTENRHELVLGGAAVDKRIKTADLHDTSLAEIPDEISKLTNLQSLVLNSNKLGNFNVNITTLSKLKLLDLSRNELKELPQEINNFPNIVTLNFTCNNLRSFPKLDNTVKLTVLDLSKNKLANFPDVCYPDLSNLSELKLNDNEIETIPAEIKKLSSLKVLELTQNKIKVVPGELVGCSKLKVLELKNNPISDRRLLKLIDQCRIKQIIDYVKTHSPKIIIEPIKDEKNRKNENQSECEDEEDYKYVITVHYAKDNIKVIINESVKAVREFFIACIINKVSFTDETYKKFIQLQNKLHETVCSKRNSSTIATHDFHKLPPGDLHYTTLPPKDLHIHPLNRAGTITGAELFSKLQLEAHNLRKEKKRNTYSGIHKYLYLIEGHSRYPCLLNSEEVVISFPPITNSEVTKIHPGTTSMLIEVTSSVSLHLCKVAMESLLKDLVLLLGSDLEVTQVRNVDSEGNLKNVYPSKADLNFEGGDIKVVRI